MSFFKAIRLELNYLKERWLSTFFFFVASAFFVFLFSVIAKVPVGWGGFNKIGFTYYDLLSPIIFPLLILFVSVQMIILRIVGERAPYGTLDRELIAISRNSIIWGKLIVNFIVVLFQCIIIYLFGFILFPVKSYALSPILIIVPFLMLGLFGLSLGLTISVFSKHKEGAVQLAPYLMLILFVTSLILIFPAINLDSNLIGMIINNNPFALISQSLNAVIINGSGFEDINYNLVKEGIWILSLMIIVLIKFNLEKK